MCLAQVPTPKPIMPPTPTRSNIDAERMGIQKARAEKNLDQTMAGAPSLRINLGATPGSGGGANLG